MNKKLYRLGDRIQFGQWKGEKIEDLIDQDPKYVDWCVKEGIIDLENDLHLMLENQAS